MTNTMQDESSNSWRDGIPEENAIVLLESIIKLNNMEDKLYEIFKFNESEISRITDDLLNTFFDLTGLTPYIDRNKNDKELDLMYEMVYNVRELDGDTAYDIYEQLMAFKEIENGE